LTFHLLSAWEEFDDARASEGKQADKTAGLDDPMEDWSDESSFVFLWRRTLTGMVQMRSEDEVP